MYALKRNTRNWNSGVTLAWARESYGMIKAEPAEDTNHDSAV